MKPPNINNICFLLSNLSGLHLCCWLLSFVFHRFLLNAGNPYVKIALFVFKDAIAVYVVSQN